MHPEVLKNILLLGEDLGATLELAFEAGGKPVGIFIKNTKEGEPLTWYIFETFRGFEFYLVVIFFRDGKVSNF